MSQPTYIEPKTTAEPVRVNKEHVLESILGNATDFVIVDLRKGDFEGGYIKGAINLPAQSLHQTIETIYAILKQSGRKHIYIHCMSSGGRATRAWGWFQDLVEKYGDEEKVFPAIMTGGIIGWINGGEEYIEHLADYDPAHWK